MAVEIINALLASNATTNMLLLVVILTNYSLRHNLERALSEMGKSYQKLIPIRWFPKRAQKVSAEVEPP